VWYFVAVLHTKFACVLTVSAFSQGFGESQYDAILSQGMFYLRVGLGPVALGPPNTDRASSPINSPGVGTGLGTLNNGY
jgi:hypothetical protein